MTVTVRTFVGRAGQKTAPAQNHVTHGNGVKPVRVLGRVDCHDYPLLADVRRKRKLHRNPVDFFVPVEPANQGEQFRLRCVGRKAQIPAFHSGLRKRLFLRGYVGKAGGIVPHQNHREAGNRGVFSLSRAARCFTPSRSLFRLLLLPTYPLQDYHETPAKGAYPGVPSQRNVSKPVQTAFPAYSVQRPL